MFRKAGLAGLVVLATCSTGGPVRGVVTGVEGDLTTVRSFVMRTDAGETLELAPAPDGDYEFALIHLRDHLRSSEPILVTYESRGGLLVAVSISDG